MAAVPLPVPPTARSPTGVWVDYGGDIRRRADEITATDYPS